MDRCLLKFASVLVGCTKKHCNMRNVQIASSAVQKSNINLSRQYSYDVPPCYQRWSLGKQKASKTILFHSRSKFDGTNRNEYNNDVSGNSGKSLSEAALEELKFISSQEGHQDSEISFPGNWAIQKMGAHVTMIKKPTTKVSLQFYIS